MGLKETKTKNHFLPRRLEQGERERLGGKTRKAHTQFKKAASSKKGGKGMDDDGRKVSA